ncbi:MAG TPA: PGPGW domain-containing protein [Clostridia bacterium]|nr:PGPGW domain-containing protein [Clostridia bacterium]
MKFKRKTRFDELSPFLRRLIVAVFGGTVLLIGLAMLVLPGPAVLVMPLGIAILATEFAWARRVAHKAQSMYRTAKQTVGGK